MKVYLVGGAVRDELLGRVPKDKDYVIVGATPDQMIALGYKQVGADFPVFLDDEGVEYALARTERKTGTGYNGFTVDANPNVTLEDDLRRRDLTINSMARDLETGQLIDPFNGQEDLRNGTLKHTSEAFAEDPLRVLRIARFSARYTTFMIASETMELMESLVGEMSTLTTERVWMELEKALMEETPDHFPIALKRCGAWQKLFPEININWNILDILMNAVRQKLTLEERIATLFACSHLSKVETCLARFNAPAELSRLIHNVWKVRQIPLLYGVTDNVKWLAVLKSVDAYRRPEGMKQMCNVLRCMNEEFLSVLADNIEAAYYATVAVDFDSLPVAIKSQTAGPAIGKAIDDQRQELLNKLTFIPLPTETAKFLDEM